MKALLGIISLLLIQGSALAEPGEPQGTSLEFYIPERMEGSVSNLRFHPEKPVVAVSTTFGGVVIYDYEEMRIISQWTAGTGYQYAGALEFLGHGNAILTATYDHDSSKGEYEVRNWKTAELIYKKELKPGHRQLEVSPDGRWVALVNFTHVEITRAANGESVGSAQVHDGPNNYHWHGELIFSNDGDNFFIPNSEKLTGYQFTLRSGSVDLIREISYPLPSIYGVFSPDGRYLMTTSKQFWEDGSSIHMGIRNVNTGKEVWGWDIGTEPLYSIQISSDQKFVLGRTINRSSSLIKVWSLEQSPTPTLVMDKLLPGVDSVMFGATPSEVIVFKSQDNFFEVYDIMAGALKSKLGGGSSALNQINLSKNMFMYSEWHKRFIKLMKF